MAFNFPRPKFLSALSLVGGLLLMFGLGLTVFSTQQQQDTRTRASTYPNPNECNTQYGNASNPRCCSKTYTGGMCKYTNQACPGGFIPQTSSYTSWYCPGGNDYRCCKDAPPVANAGSDKTITLPTNSVTLSGSCSDPDSDSRNLKSCKWTKSSGPSGGSIASPDSGSTNITGLVQGSYVYKLTASDGYLTDTDTVTVTVNAAANKAPTANAGADKEITLPTNSVTLAGSGNDSDGTITKYEWTKTSGPTTGTITSPTSASTTVTGLVEGIYKFTLKVTDNDNATHTDEVQVKVNASTQTSFSFELLLHGIGKGGDNSNPTGTGTTNPKTNPRPILVEVREDSNGPVITSKTGQLTFNSGPGNYTGTVDMGTAITASKSYVITVISKSLRGRITKGITVGTTNTIAFTLVNGDADQNGLLNILDYTMIEGCLVDPDFSPVPKDCDAERAAKADLDDDGTVLIFDLTLFLREIRVQPL